jgi:hypothetical protein
LRASGCSKARMSKGTTQRQEETSLRHSNSDSKNRRQQ